MIWHIMTSQDKSYGYHMMHFTCTWSTAWRQLKTWIFATTHDPQVIRLPVFWMGGDYIDIWCKRWLFDSENPGGGAACSTSIVHWSLPLVFSIWWSLGLEPRMFFASQKWSSLILLILVVHSDISTRVWHDLCFVGSLMMLSFYFPWSNSVTQFW